MPSSEKQSSSLMQVHRFSESVLHQEKISEASHIRVKTCACPTCKNKSESSQQRFADSPNDFSRNNQTGSIDPSLLISRAFGDITKACLSGRETLNYYIYDQSINIQYLGSELKTLEHQDDASQFINNLFLRLDPLIDLDFQATSNLDESDLTIISVDGWNAWTSDTVGQVVNLDSSWNVLWKDIEGDSLRGNASGTNDSFDANTIIQSKDKQADKIRGTQDDDFLLAGTGADILIGKGGADQFMFIQNDRFGRRGADTIKDFDIDEGDRLLLGARRLKGLDSDPTFATASRKKQLKRLTRQDIDVIYFEPRGRLIYNQNGENPRFGRGGIFAVLENKPELSSEAIHFLAA